MTAGAGGILVFLDPKTLGGTWVVKNVFPEKKMFPEADQLDNYNTDLVECKLWTQNQLHELDGPEKSHITLEQIYLR